SDLPARRGHRAPEPRRLDRQGGARCPRWSRRSGRREPRCQGYVPRADSLARDTSGCAANAAVEALDAISLEDAMALAPGRAVRVPISARRIAARRSRRISRLDAPGPG